MANESLKLGKIAGLINNCVVVISQKNIFVYFSKFEFV